MAIHNGRGEIKRRHATNYIGKEAHKRLQEAIVPAQKRGLQALEVDSFEVMYYRRSSSSIPCTCQKSPAYAAMDHNVVDPNSLQLPDSVLAFGEFDEEIVIDHSDTLFGTSNTLGEYGDNQTSGGFDPEEVDEGDDDARNTDNLFGLSTDCGICYRNGVLPAYELYGHDRKILATQVVDAAYGYHIDQGETPHRFDKIDTNEGYVDFVLHVPKYFVSARFSIRNGSDHLPDEFMYEPAGAMRPITMQSFRALAGQEVRVRILAEQFTHVVIDFDLGVEPVLAALAQDTKATDWTMFDTLGNVSMVLPMTIDAVETSDVIYVPSRGHTFKVSDVTYLRTASNGNIDWQVQARVLQPQEGLKRIYQATKLR